MALENEDKCPGLKKGGANIVRHAVEMTCPTDAIPETLVADLTGLDFETPSIFRRSPFRKAPDDHYDRDFTTPRWPPSPNSKRRWPRPKVEKTARARKAAKRISSPHPARDHDWSRDGIRNPNDAFVRVGNPAGLAPKPTQYRIMAVDEIARRHGFALSSKVSGRYFRAVGRDKVNLLKPRTYMNEPAADR